MHMHENILGMVSGMESNQTTACLSCYLKPLLIVLEEITQFTLMSKWLITAEYWLLKDMWGYRVLKERNSSLTERPTLFFFFFNM